MWGGKNFKDEIFVNLFLQGFELFNVQHFYGPQTLIKLSNAKHYKNNEQLNSLILKS